MASKRFPLGVQSNKWTRFPEHYTIFHQVPLTGGGHYLRKPDQKHNLTISISFDQSLLNQLIVMHDQAFITCISRHGLEEWK